MRFKRNRRFEQEIKRTPAYRGGLRGAGGAIKTAAQEISRTFAETGHYGHSFVIEDTPDGVAVGNTDIAAHLIEFGSVNNQPHAPLRRAVRAAGFDLKEIK